jgi:hypothetical protein
MATPHTLPPNPSRLIEGLRDTGYDFNTALADIVDNSVDAGATSIDVQIVMDTDGDIQISVADNGCGMDKSKLLDGMTYGATGNSNPRRLGKFGLGMKTASTAFCRCFSVITRDSTTTKPLKAIWDLGHVEEVNEWELLLDDPDPTELELLDVVTNGQSGTLVVWDNVDRVLKDYADSGGTYARRALKKVVDDFRFHAGMTYQRYLDTSDSRAPNIEVIVNGNPVEPWDPYCQSETETELVASESTQVELPDGTEATFNIQAFVLPRREQFSTEDAMKKAQVGNNMQGIYIYRENRLIHPADWLGMFSKEPHFSLLRVEFSFDHDLDQAFQVDIKKSRIILKEELYHWVMDQFLPAPRNAANQRYRQGRRRQVNEGATNAHADSNRSIGSKEDGVRISDIEVNDAENGTVEITNPKGKTVLRLRVGTATNNGQVHVQTVDSLEDGVLWEPALISGHHAVQINTGHPYYHKVYVPNHHSGVTVQGMDSLLWALVEAELGTINEATLSHMKELRFEVARILRALVNDLPDPELEADDA